jgi:hypothetical protein
MKFLDKIIFTAFFLTFLSSPADANPFNWLNRLETESAPLRKAHKSQAAVHPYIAKNIDTSSRYGKGYEAFLNNDYQGAQNFFLESSNPKAKSMLGYMYARKLISPDLSTLCRGLEDFLVSAGTPIARANRVRLCLAGVLKVPNVKEKLLNQYLGDLLKKTNTAAAQQDLNILIDAGLYEPDDDCTDCFTMR